MVKPRRGAEQFPDLGSESSERTKRRQRKTWPVVTAVGRGDPSGRSPDVHDTRPIPAGTTQTREVPQDQVRVVVRQQIVGPFLRRLGVEIPVPTAPVLR